MGREGPVEGLATEARQKGAKNISTRCEIVNIPANTSEVSDILCFLYEK
jgi:hypothetical protein